MMMAPGAVTTGLLAFNLIDAWLYGSLLAGVAVSLTLVFGLGRVVNFAVGSFYMIAAYLVLDLRGTLGFWAAVLVAALAMVALGAIVERVAIRPIHARPEITTVLATFGLSIVADGVVQLVWGTGTRSPNAPIGGSVSVFGQDVSVYTFVAAAVGMALAASVWLLLRRTSLGTALRGASQNRSMAQLIGIDTATLMTGLFAVSAGIAAVVGGLSGPLFSVQPNMDQDFLLNAFLAVVIGGLGSVRGAIVGAYIVALVQNLAISFITGDVATAVSFGAVILILLLRPTGIFREGRVVA
jgi:branched-subunit amino acid ABC-type transport system permease component